MLQCYNNKKQKTKEGKMENAQQTQQQIIRQKIKELKELETIEKKIAKCEADKQKLIVKKAELERKFGL